MRRGARAGARAVRVASRSGGDVSVRAEHRRLQAGGKMFALVPHAADPPTVSLKCDPEWSEVLREAYDAVQPGYHLNKKHWNTIVLDGTIPDDEIVELIEHSYALVAPRT
ncbi:MAG TPA: MmcQ/YjbR family DNA-binding protein [Gaiellaceae bacterium]